MQEIWQNSILEWRVKLDRREISSVELTGLYCDWLEKLEPSLNALISYDRELALSWAALADERISQGESTDLLGIPVVVKDNISTAGQKTTAGSKMLEKYLPPYDSTVISKLKKAGAVILAKANMDEFAMGSSNETSYFGPVKNPWDLTRVSGGSSGGSTVAVTAGYCPVSLGSDTGGSIRQPASLCGVVGLKPTYGRVSRYGLLALGSSFDQIGPLGRRVEDVAVLLKTIAGNDSLDSSSAVDEVADYPGLLNQPVRGLKIGLVTELVEGVAAPMQAVVQKTVASLEKLGAAVEKVSWPELKYSIAAYYIIQSSECSANLARYDGVRYGFGADLKELADGVSWEECYSRVRQAGFGPEVKRRIMLGTYSLSSGFYDQYFNQAAKVRTLIIAGFKKLIAEYDLLVGLTSPVTAFKLGEKMSDPLDMYLADVMTCGVNLAGVPAVSVPVGEIEGLPVGWQIIGNYFAEDRILNLAHALQGEVGWLEKLPNIVKTTMEV